MLDSNSKEKIYFFVLKKLGKDRLYEQFNDRKIVFNSVFRDSEFGMILRPSEIYLSEFIIRKSKTYHHRVEDILSYPLCHWYKYLDSPDGCLPQCCPFDCYQKIFRTYLAIYTIKFSHLDTRQHPGYVRDAPDRFGDN